MSQKDFEQLDQYDFIDGEYLEKVKDKYASLIGLFLMRFSELEHSLNLCIAEIVNSRAHDPGYAVVERLTVDNKIELFYKMYLHLVSNTNKEKKVLLQSLRDGLKSSNKFRNGLVHANWLSLKKDGSIRSKITTDSEEGYIKFQISTITPKTIRDELKSLQSLIGKLDAFCESAFEL